MKILQKIINLHVPKEVKITEISKELFKEWEQHPVTKAVKVGFDDRAKGMLEYLATEVAKDPRTDLIYSGYIQAVKDFLLVSMDDVKETE